VLTYANTFSNDVYRDYCKQAHLPIHPARMPPKLAEFFIQMLTDEGDTVMDPFAGSNTTGAVAENLGRRWISIEPNLDYIEGSRARFDATRPGGSLAR
jgi:site-specific DNA-methyltransferase (cytosine-N4-specific)